MLTTNPMPKYRSSPGQIVLFPSGSSLLDEGQATSLQEDKKKQTTESLPLHLPVVLSGSYRKDFEGLKRAYEELQDIGCHVLSPSNVVAVNEIDGFVYMKGEEVQNPDAIEARHLDAIERSSFVWLHAPNGYVGPTAALEIGFARAAGVPVYGREAPRDKILQSFVRVVGSPIQVIEARGVRAEPPAPALKAFQEYYRRTAIQRGYAKERPKDCLLLMVEEVGELARALRKREKLTRHGPFGDSNEGHELADVFLYVIHMANALGLDLASVVKEKEFINLEKFLAT
jgi:NTP pyrophosphatase (non-canonical NTP hydrolase)